MFFFHTKEMETCEKETVQVILGPNCHSGDNSNTTLGRWRLIQFAISFEAADEKGFSLPCNLRA